MSSFYCIVLSFFLVILSSTSGFAAVQPMLDQSAMDLSVDPCEDFEQYSCGKWEETVSLPADRPILLKSITSIIEENLKTNQELLENFAKGKNLKLSRNSKKLGLFYSSCLNTEKILARAHAFLDQFFAPLETLTLDSLSRWIGELQGEGISVLMRFGSDQDFSDSSKMIASIDQGGYGLPEREYYFDENKANIREKYVLHIAKMLELSGLPHEEATAGAQSVLKFETELVQKALNPLERRDPKNLYHIKSLAQLNELTPIIHWDVLFKAAESPNFTQLNVIVPDFLSHLNSLLEKTSLADLKTYIRWHLISAVSMDLGGDFAQERFNFYQKILMGQKEMKPRWKFCVNNADASLADALGSAFVAKTFGKEGKKQALKIVDMIQKVFEKNLREIDWMDDSTREYAIKKLDVMLKKIGYPDRWRDLSKLKIGDDHMTNAINTSRFAKNWELSKIGKPTDRSEWLFSPSVVNAFYNPTNNEINFPAGILQSPMFSAKEPLSVNYGCIGGVIGHEMTHGFDDEGGQFDMNGNLKNWWSPQVHEIFEKKAQCLVDQFSKYTTVDGLHLSGKLTLGENIADLGGLKLALAAFKTTLPPKYPEAKYTTEMKNFFIAYAQGWCSKATPEIKKLRVASDVHSPEKFRVNGVVANIPDFAKTFDCKTGKPLAPENRCEVW